MLHCFLHVRFGNLHPLLRTLDELRAIGDTFTTRGLRKWGFASGASQGGFARGFEALLAEGSRTLLGGLGPEVFCLCWGLLPESCETLVTFGPVALALAPVLGLQALKCTWRNTKSLRSGRECPCLTCTEKR